MHFREPHPGEQDGGPRSGAERDATPIQRRKRHLRDEIDRQYWPVGPHGQIGQEQQLVRVSQVLQQRNRADVEIPRTSASLSRSGVSLVNSTSSSAPERTSPQ